MYVLLDTKTSAYLIFNIFPFILDVKPTLFPFKSLKIILLKLLPFSISSLSVISTLLFFLSTDAFKIVGEIVSPAVIKSNAVIP